jgi:hypothetical protein
MRQGKDNKAAHTTSRLRFLDEPEDLIRLSRAPQQPPHLPLALFLLPIIGFVIPLLLMQLYFQLTARLDFVERLVVIGLTLAFSIFSTTKENLMRSIGMTTGYEAMATARGMMVIVAGMSLICSFILCSYQAKTAVSGDSMVPTRAQG